MTMSRADRRRFDRHQLSVDRVTAADAAYFERWPDRRHRVRLAAAAEVAQNAILAPEEDLNTVKLLLDAVEGIRKLSSIFHKVSRT